MMISRHFRSTCIAVFLAAIFFLQAFASSAQKSLTWDEPSYIAAGFTYLTRNDFRLNASHPPLMQEMAALPLLFMNLKVPRGLIDDWMQHYNNPVVAFGRALIFESGNDAILIARWARVPVMLMGTGLILALFLWGRQLYGDAGALVATALAALSPNLLAHSRLATEDLGCAALMFVAVWTFWLGWSKDRTAFWVLCGAVTGLALLSKFTALLLGPIYLVLTVVLFASEVAKNWALAPARRTVPTRKGVIPRCLSSFLHNLSRQDQAVKPVTILKAFAIIGSVCFILIGAGYNFSFDWRLYFNGLGKIYADLVPPYYFYLWGHVSDEPMWYYHVVAFLIKVPIPAMGMILLAVVSAVLGRCHREAVIFLLVPALVVVVASFFDRANFGLRRILPAFPFLFLFAGTVLASRDHALSMASSRGPNGPGPEGKKFDRRPMGFRRLAVIVLLGWMIVEAILIYPHHLSYFNRAVGGPMQGPHLLDDSNIDWGQDLPALAAWQSRHPEAVPLKLFYFGTAVPEAYGVQTTKFDQAELANPQPGTYAVSVHALVRFRTGHKKAGLDIDWLSKFEKNRIGRAGYSIYIYRFP